MKPGNYTLQDISRIVEGDLIGNSDPQEIIYLIIDSRKIVFPKNSIFFAIHGPQHDGHQYLNDAIKAGVRNFIISNKKNISNTPPDCRFIVVNDTLAALQKLAGHHRRLFHIPLVGITGSNGKTIVKDWLSQVLSIQYNVCKSPKSYNSQVGVPLSVWNLHTENEIGIFEAGISQKGEMQRLETIIQPQIGIFTNIGTAHEENFSSMEEKIREKLLLFQHADTIILRNDSPLVESESRKIYSSKNIVSWGRTEQSRFKCSTIEKSGDTEIYLTDGDTNYTFTIPFADPASVENAVHVFVAAIILKADMAIITEQMKWLSKVNMRLSFKTGKNNCFIIDDTYSNDLDSLKIAIDSLTNLAQYPKKTIILSDIAQSKTKKEDLYKEVAQILQQKKIDKVIGIGEEINQYQSFFKGDLHFFKNADTLVHHLHDIHFNNEAILIKGARSFGLEKIVTRLENKVHDTVLEVNLNAMVNNLNYYRSHIPAGTKIMAMVKASGYGTGTHEIAHVLNFHHVDYLSVAYTDEGIELRNRGIELPIMVMNAEATSYELLIEKKLEPVIYNFEYLLQLTDHKQNGGNIPPIHLEIDTGMHRLGFDVEKIDELIALLKKERGVEIKSIFSHLAASDEPDMDPFTIEQLNLFKEIAGRIEKELGIKVIKHIANSAGASRFNEAAFDMIRLGVGLYGVGSNESEQAKLQPVVQLFSTITQITSIKKGSSVGYGRSYIAEKDMKIATVPIGYADGYRRSLGNGKGKMFVNGIPAHVIGRVCMDMTMIDITGIEAEIGDQVEIIGENHPIGIFAKSIDTIPYEVLTSISQRVRRVYTQE